MKNDLKECLVSHVVTFQVTVIYLRIVFHARYVMYTHAVVPLFTTIRSPLDSVGWWLIPSPLTAFATVSLEIISRGPGCILKYRDVQVMVVIVQATLFCVPGGIRTG